MKVVFLTYHNWETKRHGGFHKFAEEACNRGFETIFFSFSRPYYIYFKHDERLNKKVLKDLTKGIRYKVGKGSLLNITFPTLSLPGIVQKYLPQRINKFLIIKSFKSFSKFARKHFSNTDYFVIESNESILLYSKLKVLFPESKFIYRPSDPLVVDENYLSDSELELIQNVDQLCLVNSEGYEIYNNALLEHYNKKVEDCCNYNILNNGVNLNEYAVEYTSPALLKQKKNALYVGAIEIEWDLMIRSAEQILDVNFIIITPSNPPSHFIKKVHELENLYFINGISPEEVPHWLTNCDVVIVPNPKDRYKIKPWGLTAKYLQAMAAKKQVVVYHDTAIVKEAGIKYTYTYNDFISELKEIDFDKKFSYEFDLKSRSWNAILDQFYNNIENL